MKPKIVNDVVHKAKDILGPAISTGAGMVKSRVFSTVDLRSVQWDIDDSILIQYFPNIPKKYVYSKCTYTKQNRGPAKKEIVRNRTGKKWTDKQRTLKNRRRTRVDSNYERDVDVSRIPGKFVDFYKYKGTVIFLVIENIVTGDNRNGDQVVDYKSFVVLNRKIDIKHLDEFIMMLIRKSDIIKQTRSTDTFWMIESANSTMELTKRSRSFDDVFIPKTTEDQIVKSIQSFIDKRSWYAEHKIPYHFGILLHGPGGTGKTSIIQAIINQFDSFAYIADSMEAIIDTKHLFMWKENQVHPTIIICEDIDTAIFTNSRHADVKDSDNDNKIDRRQMLGRLLNFMDGNASPENVIYIFTTNYVNDLDVALIRPGRIDLSLEIGYIIDETMDKFLMFHYGQHLPKDFHVKDHLTFAQLQTEVMRGMSFDSMIAEYCE